MNKIKLIFAATVVAAVLVPTVAFAAGPYYVDPTGNDGNACTAPGASACLTVQGAVNKASAGDTINVAAGTYSGNIIIPSGLNNLTITGAGPGSTTFNLASGYGVNLDNGYAVTGFTLSGFTFNSSSGTTYAFKAYKADNLTLTNDIFNGNSFGGGVDINTTSHVLLDNVTATSFHKNGFAVTAAYTVIDQTTPSTDITFNNITASNNGWTGISFYTVGNDHSPTSIGGSASMSGIHFTGANTISGNGGGASNGTGMHIEGDSDAHEGTIATPTNTVTSDGTTLDITHMAFSGNSHDDVVNYQTAPVNAIGATFGGLTGDAMNGSQRTAEDGMIIDQLDHPVLGLVTYYSVPSVTTNAADSVSTTAATLHATNGPVAGDNTSFWWGTTSAGPFTAAADPSSEFPSGWSHDSGLGSAIAGASFNEPLSGLTAGTTYYFVAWVHVNGVWYPGQVLSFDTASAPTPTVTTNSATGETTSGATLNGTDGSVAGDNTSFWWGTTAPVVPITTPGADPASTGEFPAGWSHDSGLGAVAAGGAFSEPLTGLTPGTKYYFVAWVQVGGIWYPGQTLSFIEPTTVAMCPAGTAQSASPVDTFSVNSNSSTPTPGSVSLTNGQQYIVTASGTWQNSSLNVADAAFSSVDSWTNYMEGYDIAPYFLGPQEFALQVGGQFVNWGPYDGAGHTYSYAYTGNGSPISLGVFDGDSNTNTANPSWYGDNSGSLSVAIYPCNPTTGTISGEKFNDLNRNKHKDAGEPGLQGWTIRLEDKRGHVLATTTTDVNGNYTFANLAPGTYKLREVHQNGWVRMTKNPKNIVIVAGAVVTDVDFGNATIKHGERPDNDQDDQRDDQDGNYQSHPGHDDYGTGQIFGIGQFLNQIFGQIGH